MHVTHQFTVYSHRFQRQAKLHALELKFSYQKNFLRDGQTRFAKSSSQLVDLPSKNPWIVDLDFKVSKHYNFFNCSSVPSQHGAASFSVFCFHSYLCCSCDISTSTYYNSCILCVSCPLLVHVYCSVIFLFSLHSFLQSKY